MEQHSLVERLRQHDEAAYQELLDSYGKLLWTIAGGVLSQCDGAQQEVEECISDVLIALWNKPDCYDPKRGSLKSYLCKITKNKAIDRYRKICKENVVQLQDYIEIEAATDYDLGDLPDYSALYEEIKRLGEPTREIMIRRYFYDQKPSQIADTLKLPKKQVENCLYRGKKNLADNLMSYREVR